MFQPDDGHQGRNLANRALFCYGKLAKNVVELYFTKMGDWNVDLECKAFWSYRWNVRQGAKSISFRKCSRQFQIVRLCRKFPVAGVAQFCIRRIWCSSAMLLCIELHLFSSAKAIKLFAFAKRFAIALIRIMIRI